MASETTAPDPESPTVEVLVTRAQPSLTVNTGLRVRKSLPVEALKRIGFAPTSSGRSKPSSNQLIRDILRKPLYLDCSYVEFLKVKKDLIKLSSNLQNAVKVVKMQKKIVNKQIEKWLKDSDNILQGVQSLENKIASVQGQGQGFSSLKWLSQFRLRKKVAKKTRVITSLLNDVENRFPAMSSGISSFSTFMSFKSWSLACQNMMEALKEYDVSILALCAMAGAGKTIFAREVGKKALELQLFDEVVMVDASQQSDSHKIRSYVVDCLELKLANNGEYGAQDLSDNLRLRRVLIILDDVWKKPNLEEIGIPYGGDHGGCKILLTISNRQVCSSMNIDRTIELDVLDDKDSCSLFRTVVGLSDSGPDDDIYKVAESIATESHGFPLLVVKLGRSLKQKAEEEWGLALERHESSSVSSAVICGYMDEDDEFMISYEFLRSRKTKMCFLLMCSLFPQGYDIDVEDFLKYIWGVRLFREVGSNQSIEDQRCEMWRAIEELKAYYLLLGREGNNNVHVKLHNLVRECALSIASGLITTLTPQVDLFEDLPEDMARDIDTAIIKMARHTQLPDNYMVHGEVFSAWRNLRMLDLYDCLMKEKIRPDLIHKLYMQEPCRLEELRIGGPRFKEWPFEFEFEFQVASPGGSNGNARVSDRIKSLPFLPILSLDIPCLSNPDQDMVFPKLLKYQIAINDDSGFHHCYPISRVVKVTDLSFNAVKELFRNVQHLHLNRIAGYQNLVPCAGADLDELTFLALRSCPDMEFILDMKQQHVPVPVPVPHCALSELEELIIEEMGCLKQLCNGRPPQGFLQKLRRLTVTKCADMMFTVAATQSLQELSVKSCDKLQSVFHSHSEEKHASSLLSCLRYLELIELPELRCVWSGPIHQVAKFFHSSERQESKIAVSYKEYFKMMDLMVLEMATLSGV
ncbi:Disease resistance protein [Corchorus olitorius]|uniref:Disease resistance protein n=1 Tax=Corchorus olitorius TaxID=93759 RepID=A0A1R3KBP6_9ROSI|nr:Disease resistance protein [Corchorus olitorius]